MRSSSHSLPQGTGLPRSTRPLIVFSDDWGRHPSSCQHLVRNLLNVCQVYWINTIGTRTPGFTSGTASRAFEKLSQWSTKSNADALPNPHVLNPLMWPGFRTRWQRFLNHQLLERNLRSTISSFRDCVLLTTIPLVSDLLDSLDVARSVYYCVDDFSVWPGLDSEVLRSTEMELIAKVDRIIAAGPCLADHITRSGRHVTVIDHGIDFAHWTADDDGQFPAELERPVATFWGLIDARLDVDFLTSLASALKKGTILLVGPEQDPDPKLAVVSRIRKLGPVPYSHLPSIALRSNCLIMPYRDLAVTRAMQPLKLKEYLATGRPVITTRIPAIAEWEDCLDVVDTPEAFARVVSDRFSSGLPACQAAARTRLQYETWPSKAAQLRSVLFED